MAVEPFIGKIQLGKLVPLDDKTRKSWFGFTPTVQLCPNVFSGSFFKLIYTLS
jgi:hypothetical protein